MSYWDSCPNSTAAVLRCKWTVNGCHKALASDDLQCFRSAFAITHFTLVNGFDFLSSALPASVILCGHAKHHDTGGTGCLQHNAQELAPQYFSQIKRSLPCTKENAWHCWCQKKLCCHELSCEKLWDIKHKNHICGTLHACNGWCHFVNKNCHSVYTQRSVGLGWRKLLGMNPPKTHFVPKKSFNA